MMDFSLVDSVLVVQAAACDEWRRVLMCGCLAALAMIALAVAVRFAARRIGDAGRRGRAGLAVFLAGALVAMIYGGVGSGWGFTFMAESGLHDAGSYVDTTNATLHARWTFDPWVSGYKFKWFYTYKYGGETRGPFLLPDADVSAGHADCQLTVPAGQDWTAGTVTCYTQWVQPIHVITNGVYHLGGVMRSIDTTNAPMPKFVTPGVYIYANLSDGSVDLVAPPTNPPPVPVSSPVTSLSLTPENEGE